MSAAIPFDMCGPRTSLLGTLRNRACGVRAEEAGIAREAVVERLRLAACFGVVPVVVLGAALAGLALPGTSTVSAQPARFPEATKPQAMLNAEASRRAESFKTGHLEVVIEETVAGVERASFLTWRFAGPDVILVNHGDENDIVIHDPAGGSAGGDYNTSLHMLLKGDQLWQHHERSPLATVFRADEFPPLSELYDPRLLGLAPERTRDTLEARVARQNLGPLLWESEPDGPLERVAVRIAGDKDDGAYVWWLDPHKGWNPVRMQVIVNSTLLADIVVDLHDQGGGLWFPRKIEEFTYQDGARRPFRVIDVRYAAFNRPNHPRSFTPTDIGVEVGTNLTMRDRTPFELLVWDGARGVPTSEFTERLSRGELELGPTRSRESARVGVLSRKQHRYELLMQQLKELAMEVRPVAYELDAWEKYTAEFIKQSGLDDGQQERALGILKDCKNEAESFLSRKRSDIDALDARGTRMQREKITPLDQWRVLYEDRQRLIAPLTDIFENRLKPRLDALLTREQREARAATSKPAP